MEKLTNKEEELMHILWQLEGAFVKEIVAELPTPKPHYNTISTTIRRMVDKGFVNFESYGNTYKYFPAISKAAYRKSFMQKTIHNYFANSYSDAVSFFAKEEKISVEELKEIIRLIEKKE